MNLLKIFLKKKNNNKKKILSNKYPINGIYTYNYNENPKTSVIINHFVSFRTLTKTIENLRVLGNNIEIIVINDTGKNSDKIFNNLNQANDKLIVTSNLSESKGYISGASISQSTDYLIFTQDDDLAPEDGEWYNDVIKIFKKYKDLSMVSLNGGGLLSIKNNNLNKVGYDLIDFSKIKPKFKTKFFFCTWVKTGPIIIKKKVFEKIGGWQMFAKIGEADHFADMDLAIRVF